MDWNEAVRYGLIDKVLEQRGELPAPTRESRRDLPMREATKQNVKEVNHVNILPCTEGLSCAVALCFMADTVL